MAAPTTTENNNNNSTKIPNWINEDNFQDILAENVKGFKKVLNFEVKETGGCGENYASIMMRVKVKAELKDGSTKDVGFMIKTLPQGEDSAALISMMGMFPKEIAMYDYLREFEEMYRAVGKTVTFGPKFYKLKNGPGAKYVLLEDLSPRGFKNLDRHQGLDKAHTKSVLKLLAELHAVSAVRYEVKGQYGHCLMESPFKDDCLEILENLSKPSQKILKTCLAKHETGRKYLPKLDPIFSSWTEQCIKDNKVHLDDFNVINHGDLWSNNIMFRQTDEGEWQEPVFVDFQMSRFASPVVDLFYFLLSSPELDIKVNCFDEFIQFYHENLTENLKLLNYPKELPTLKQLRMNLLKYSSWAVGTTTGVLTAVLLDPSENANMDNFFDESEKANDFRSQVYDNPRYIQHLDVILPWLDKMGYLDEL